MVKRITAYTKDVSSQPALVPFYVLGITDALGFSSFCNPNMVNGLVCFIHLFSSSYKISLVFSVFKRG
jgi:hypothetical protein